MGPALRPKGDPGGSRDQHEAGVLVAGVVQGVEPALNEGIVQGSDRQQPGPEKAVRQT